MSSNTTSKVITTKAGEALIAQMQAENKVLVIDKFIFANVPNRPDFPQREDLLPTEYVVHESAVHEQGRMTENSVIYSTTLASNVGPFTFNWSGLYCSEHNTLVAINFPAAVDKTVDGPGVTGNTLVRSFVLEYKGIAETTNITVDPASWQYDAHKRMSKMDNDSAQAIIDQNGKDWFIDDGFIVTPQSTAYNIKAGAGYVSGHRITLDFDRIVQAPIKPSFIYVDAYREGNPTGEWVTKFNFVVSPDEKDDYTDAQGIQHFVCKIAQVMEDGSVGDLRTQKKIIGDGSGISVKPIYASVAKTLNTYFLEYADITQFGAVAGSGVSYEKANKNRIAIQLAHDFAREVIFPNNEVFVITLNGQKGIECRSNRTIKGNFSTIKLKHNDSNNKYQLYDINEIKNVVVDDLMLNGDLDQTETYDSEHGHGFNIIVSENIWLNRCYAEKCAGDGYYIGVKDDYLNTNVNVNLIDCIGDKNFRQGLSLTSGVRISITRGEYKNTGYLKGTAPGAGIDIEPNANQGGDLDVTLTDVRTFGNMAQGLLLSLQNIGVVKKLPTRDYVQCDIKVVNLTSKRDGGPKHEFYESAFRIVGIESSNHLLNKIKGSIKFISQTLNETMHIPMEFTNIGGIPNVSFVNTTVIDTEASLDDGIAAPSGSSLFDIDFRGEALNDVNYPFSKVTFDGYEYIDTRGDKYSSVITPNNHRVKRPIFYKLGNPSAVMSAIVPKGFWVLNNFKTNIKFDENRMGTFTSMWKFGGDLPEQDIIGDTNLSQPDMPVGQVFNCIATGAPQVIRLPDADEYSVGQELHYKREDSSERLVFEAASSDIIVTRQGISTEKGGRHERGYSAGFYKFVCPENNVWVEC